MTIFSQLDWYSFFTLLPRRVWKTGPYFLAHFAVTRAWSTPNWMRLPNMGTPGISGSPLILGTSVAFKNLITAKITARTAKPSIWYDMTVCVDAQGLVEKEEE